MAHRPRRLLIAAISLLLTTTACGGDDPDPNAGPSASGTPSVTSTPTASASGTARPGTSASGAPGSSTGSSASPGSGSGTGTSSGSPAKPGASGSASASAAPKRLFLGLRLAKRCVVPGQEQMARINSEPGAGFVIDTLYADKKEGHTHGGFHHGKTDSEGVYEYTWRILPGTPSGQASTVVKALKDGKRGEDIERFMVASIC